MSPDTVTFPPIVAAPTIAAVAAFTSPVISTSLYFVVFGSVIGGYIQKIDGVSYGSYIVPGLLMLTLLTQSISNTSFGIFFPIYRIFSTYKFSRHLGSL
mgnify:CR=1 FL=1